MSAEIRCKVVGGDETMMIGCDGDPLEEYWPVRFAVDEYIAKRDIRDGARIRVELNPRADWPNTPVGRTQTWIVRTRQVGKHRIRFGVIERTP